MTDQMLRAHYVESPEMYQGRGPVIFLAGGISQCVDWQSEAYRLLAAEPVVVLNPRRTNFSMSDPAGAEQQICWEYQGIQRADVVLFWFADGPSPQPIALYELGATAAALRPMVVGAHPGYSRLSDVRIQLSLIRPELAVHSTLEATTAAAALQAVPTGADRRRGA